nr:ubiquitin-specific protease 13 [Tanacetum cinerariifolium]
MNSYTFMGLDDVEEGEEISSRKKSFIKRAIAKRRHFPVDKVHICDSSIGIRCCRKRKGEVVMSKGKKIKVKDKEVGEKKRKKDSEPSSSEDEKPLKNKTKGKGKGPSKPTKKVLSDNQIRREKFLSDYLPLLSRIVPFSFFHAIRDAKVHMKSFMKDSGFHAFHLINIDTLPNHLARFVVRAFDSKIYNFYLKTGVVHVTAEKVHEILGLPIGGISLYDLPER